MNCLKRLVISKLICLLFISLFCGIHVQGAESLPDGSAVQWRDTLYVRVADSAFIDNAIVFSIQIYRPNDDWNKDKVLGDFDFYFSYSSKAFSTTQTPSFVSVLPQIDKTSTDRKNLLLGYTQFYAGRFGVCGRADNAGAQKYTIPLKTWVELCRVKIPMAQVDQNPGLQWDLRATGAMTAGGNPIILKPTGDILNNPKATVKAKGITVLPQLQCQGEDVYLYVHDAITSGSGLSFTWQDSIVGENWNTLGTFDATSTVKHGSSKDGRYQFDVLGAGDTLVIRKTPGVVNGMFFKCTLADASVGASMTVDTVVMLRDSLWGYLASTEPTEKYGMSSTIDTVKKCPDTDAALTFYMFGPSREAFTADRFGRNIKVYYKYQDKDLNTKRDSFEIARTTLLSGIKRVGTFPAGSIIKKDIYSASVQTEHVGKMWIESIATEFCNNGASFTAYDTLYLEEAQGDISYNLADISVGVGDEIALDTARTTAKEYTIGLKTDPSPLDSWIEGSNAAGEIYTYHAGMKAGDDTVYYAYKVGKCELKAYRRVEVVENSYLTMKVLLEGPYLGVDSKGRDTMNCFYAQQEGYNVNIFPRTNVFKLKSPYDDTVLDSDIKTINDIATDGTICDWIYVKLRECELKDGSDQPGEHYVDSTSAFILNDGRICGLDGGTLKFRNITGKKVFIEIKHRNHLKVISKSAVTLPTTEPVSNVFTVDFTKASEVFFGDMSLKIILGKGCLIAGDLNNDGFITVIDQNFVINNDGLVQYLYDVNQDNFIVPQDNVFIIKNDGEYSRVP